MDQSLIPPAHSELRPLPRALPQERQSLVEQIMVKNEEHYQETKNTDTYFDVLLRLIASILPAPKKSNTRTYQAAQEDLAAYEATLNAFKAFLLSKERLHHSEESEKKHAAAQKEAEAQQMHKIKKAQEEEQEKHMHPEYSIEDYMHALYSMPPEDQERFIQFAEKLSHLTEHSKTQKEKRSFEEVKGFDACDDITRRSIIDKIENPALRSLIIQTFNGHSAQVVILIHTYRTNHPSPDKPDDDASYETKNNSCLDLRPKPPKTTD